LGGIVLAVGMLVVAKFYEKMMHLLVFYRITLLVELIALGIVLSFLLFKYHYANALFIYASYQVTFMFGGYLMRVETLVLKKTALLSFADVVKQKGYLLGMVLSYGFYKLLDYVAIVRFKSIWQKISFSFRLTHYNNQNAIQRILV